MKCDFFLSIMEPLCKSQVAHLGLLRVENRNESDFRGLYSNFLFLYYWSNRDENLGTHVKSKNNWGTSRVPFPVFRCKYISGRTVRPTELILLSIEEKEFALPKYEEVFLTQFEFSSFYVLKKIIFLQKISTSLR